MHDRLEFGPQQIEVRCRQGRKKSIAHTAVRCHRGKSALWPWPPRPDVSRNGRASISMNPLSLHALTQIRSHSSNKFQTRNLCSAAWRVRCKCAAGRNRKMRMGNIVTSGTLRFQFWPTAAAYMPDGPKAVGIAEVTMTRLRTHPGEVLKEEYLVPLEMSARALAKELGVLAADRNHPRHARRHRGHRDPAGSLLPYRSAFLAEPASRP